MTTEKCDILSPVKGRLCTRGIWDESIPDIKFDASGQSNYACLYDTLCNDYPRGATGLREWENLSAIIKKSGNGRQYDCIIGVSGGTDSSFLLHLIKEQGFRPLAVNLDNGWNNEISDRNILKMTQALDIDLLTVKVNFDEIRDLTVCYMKAGLPWIDIPSDLAIKACLYKIAARRGIKFILRGNDFRSEGSQPTAWTYGDGRQLKYLHRKFGRTRLKSFPNYTLLNLVYYGGLLRIQSIYPFYYLNYRKKEAQEFLSDRYGWEYYGGHHYENNFTRFAISCWAFEKFGIDKRKITLSAQILNGEISRDDAISEISQAPCNELDKEHLVNYILNNLEVSPEDYAAWIRFPNHRFTDYPSYYPLLKKWSKSSGFMLRILFPHKPQFLYKETMTKVK